MKIRWYCTKCGWPRDWEDLVVNRERNEYCWHCTGIRIFAREDTGMLPTDAPRRKGGVNPNA